LAEKQENKNEKVNRPIIISSFSSEHAYYCYRFIVMRINLNKKEIIYTQQYEVEKANK
jgi:hypothetical protein